MLASSSSTSAKPHRAQQIPVACGECKRGLFQKNDSQPLFQRGAAQHAANEGAALPHTVEAFKTPLTTITVRRSLGAMKMKLVDRDEITDFVLVIVCKAASGPALRALGGIKTRTSYLPLSLDGNTRYTLAVTGGSAEESTGHKVRVSAVGPQRPEQTDRTDTSRATTATDP